jgi:excisionase family DNA binding protein
MNNHKLKNQLATPLPDELAQLLRDAGATIPDTEPLLISVEETAHSLGIGRTTVYGLVRDGHLRTVKIGHRTLIPVAEILALIGRSTS